MSTLIKIKFYMIKISLDESKRCRYDNGRGQAMVRVVGGAGVS